MKPLRLLLILLAGLVVAVIAYHLGKGNAAREMADATNYDRIREVALQGFFVASNDKEAFFNGCDAVLERYSEVKDIEKRLEIGAKEREITERLVVQYYFSQDRELPGTISSLLLKDWDKSTFVFTKKNQKQNEK